MLFLFSGISMAVSGIFNNPYNILPISQDSDESGITFIDGWLVYSSSDRFNSAGGWDLWAVHADDVFSKRIIYSFKLNLEGLSIPEIDNSLLISGVDTVNNEASPSYNPLTQELYFHSDRPMGMGLEDIYKVSIVIRDKKGIIVKSVENIGEPINSPFVEACPCISKDGKFIIFASNRDGGYGGLDLWFSVKNKNRWSEPVNMGPLINTSGNEKYPYLTDIGLFWASDGRVDSKGYDIYFTTDYIGGSSEVIRLPSPMNSQFNDWGLAVYNDRYIIWSSDRPGGAGGVDLLSVEIPELKPDVMAIIMSVLD
jgi:hypothetical protein